MRLTLSLTALVLVFQSSLAQAQTAEIDRHIDCSVDALLLSSMLINARDNGYKVGGKPIEFRLIEGAKKMGEDWRRTAGALMMSDLLTGVAESADQNDETLDPDAMVGDLEGLADKLNDRYKSTLERKTAGLQNIVSIRGIDGALLNLFENVEQCSDTLPN